MVEPSNPHNVEGENPEQPVVAVEEDEDDDGGAIGGSLPVLKWSKHYFDNLMLSLQMPREFGAIYPQEGDTGADAPAGYITLWAEFFYDGNLRLPTTVFVADILEYYKIHISQLSPFGMFRIRNFEYTFHALGLAVTVENFRRFYQLTVNTGFFSFNQRYGSTKLMTPPKGVTKWKTKFFYIRTFAVYARMSFQDVNVAVDDEDIPVATAETVDWFSRLRPIELKRLDNNQLWLLRMMLTRPDRKARPVLREKSGETAVGLWRMFEPDFEGRVALVACELRESFNLEILNNFRVPARVVMDAPMPVGQGVLRYLGKFEKRIPKKHAEKKHVKKPVQGRGKGRTEGSVAPPLVSQAAGTYRSCYRRYTDYVVVSDTLEGLGVPGGSAAVSGKRKPEQTVAGGELKRVKLKARRAAPAQKKPAVAADEYNFFHCFVCRMYAGFSFFDFPLPSSPSAAVDAGVQKESEVPKEAAAPFGVTPDPTVRVEETVEKTASQIFDIADAGPQKSSAGEKVTGSSSGGAGYDGPPIQPGESELEYYHRTYTQDRSTAYHRPSWTVMQGDDISNDPSACKEILGGSGTPFETERARAAPRELRIN
ncbi:hypothetical protein Hanom_Chr05g00407031 [Helianthus anomalus]